MVVSFLVTALLALRSVVIAVAPTPAPCSYTPLPPATRQLLQRIDQTLPRVVTRMQQADHDNRMPYVELDSCFRAVMLEHLYTEAAETRMRYDLRQIYYKQLGDPSFQHRHVASLLVLAYASVEAATHAQYLQDSLHQDLQQRCQGRIMELEPCVGLDSHRFTRIGSHLLHYTLYSQDPYWRRSLRELASTLTNRLRDAAAVSASEHVPPATRRRTTPLNRP